FILIVATFHFGAPNVSWVVATMAILDPDILMLAAASCKLVLLLFHVVAHCCVPLELYFTQSTSVILLTFTRAPPAAYTSVPFITTVVKPSGPLAAPAYVLAHCCTPLELYLMAIAL